MRKWPVIILVVALLASLASNVVLVNRVSILRSTQAFYEISSKRWGTRAAERDFSDGHPAYYLAGEINMSDFGNPPMLTNKPGRIVCGLGCLIFPGDESFIQAYNQRMDGLFAARQQPQISKP